MTESVIADTELKLTATIKDGILTLRWEKLPTAAFLFHDGYGALLRVGSGATAGLVELHRVRAAGDPESVGHIEPLL